ncbi:MAG: mercury resistance system transport protein MerF [Candidatus Manganitrophaceae bacterium]|nr:MAG: mercury resistance system transport protein MerF [Candidatus Manganitrophaceae bacterium]
MAKSEAYMKAGGIGAVIAAICCFTPVLVILLGVVGLSIVTGYLDYLLIPALLICLGLLAYGMVLRKKEQAACCDQKKLSSGGPS